MRFDGPTFARAWLAVTTAAGTDPDAYHLYRAVHIEVFPAGVRLVSTNTLVLLVAWVPFLEDMGDEVDGTLGDADQPSLAEVPIRTLVVRDLEHRARGFLRFVIKRLSGFPKEIRNRAGLVPIEARLGVDIASTEEDTALEGMEARALELALPDAERVLIPELIPATFPDWRSIIASLPLRRATTSELAFSPIVLTSIAAVARYVPGEITWTLAGKGGPIHLRYACPRPVLSGVAMPRRDPTDTAPVDHFDPDEDDDEDDEEPLPGT